MRRLALLGLLLVMGAAAQVPTPEPSTVSLEAESTTLMASVDRSGTLAITVTHVGTSSGTPLDQERTILLAVTGADAGWTASIEPSSVRLPPGGTATVELIAQPAATAVDNVRLTVTAALLPRGVDGVPVVGEQVDPEATDTLGVRAERSDPVARQVLELFRGPWIFALLLGLLAAVAVTARLLVVGGRPTVALRCMETEKQAPAGSRARFTIAVRNLRRRSEAVAFQVSTVPEGWGAFLPVPDMTLPADAQAEVDLVVVLPKRVQKGTRQEILVEATGAGAPRRAATVRVQVQVA